MTLELQATPEEVMRAVEALQEFASQHGAGQQDLFGLALALEECGSNIVNHALQRDERQKFRVTFGQSGPELFVELRDHGPAFDPLQVREKPRSDDAPPGGWGIQLVRRYMDEIRYAREGGENVLRLIKRFGRPSESDPLSPERPEP
jgi:anti-sigma regulatory factor (Ser/Thr protein kinase)